MKKGLITILFIMLVCLAIHPEFAEASTPVKIEVQPDQILMGASYDGVNISVSGEIPADSDAFIRVIGHQEDSRLKKKGQALGFLWMNLGSVEFHKVPSVFLIYRSTDDNKFFHSEQEAWESPDLGLNAIRKQVDIVSDYKDKEALFEEFVKLKQKSGLYGAQEGRIRYQEEDKGMRSFSCSLRLPSGLPQGVYKVEIFALKKGGIAGYSAKEIRARQAGMSSLIASLAFSHGTLYGVLAVLVAIIAGLLTGVLFKGEKGAH